MPRNFVLYFPIDCSGGNDLCATVEGIMCERLGGVTSYPARGTFKMKGGQRVSDNLQVLECFCEADQWTEQEPFFLTLAGAVGAILGQALIACAIDGRMQMVAPLEPGENGRTEVLISDCSEHALTTLVLDRVEQKG